MTDTQNTTAPASLVPEIRPEVWADLEQRYRKLEDTVRRYNPSANFQQIRAAFEFAAKAHGAQMRKDGSPFITHPLAVAQIGGGGAASGLRVHRGGSAPRHHRGYLRHP